MASLALGIAGAGLGFLAGGPAGAQMGFAVGVTLGGLLFPPSAGSRGRLDDLRVTGSAYGSRIPRIYGMGRVAGNMIWAADLVEHHHQEGGGSGGGGVTQYTYTCSFAMSVCEGPITSIDRIWADDLIIYQNGQFAKNVSATFYLGDEVQTPDPTMEAALGVGNVPAYRGQAYVVFEDLPLDNYGNRIPNCSFEVTQGSATVNSILTDIANQCGLLNSDYAFTYADEAVPGFVIADRSSAKTLLEGLLRYYQVDLCERDGLLVALPRGGDTVADIADADICALSGSDKPGEGKNRRSIARVQEMDLPQGLTLSYLADAGRHFQFVTQTAQRHTKTDSVQEVQTETVPLVLADPKAKQMVTTVLYQRWLERTTYKFVLPLSYLALAPGSPVNYPINGVLSRCRITQVDIPLFGALVITAVPDRTQVLTQASAGGATGVTRSALIPCFPAPFDAWSCPQLRPADGTSAGFYVVASGSLPASIFYSTDGGTTYVPAGQVTLPSIFGTTTSVLSDWTVANTFDHSDFVNVSVNGTLVSTSEADVTNTTDNNSLIGSEIVGYATASAIDPTDYTLSDLLRGRNNSVMTGHTSGERFVKLDPASIVRVSVPSTLVGTTIAVKVVASCQSINDVAPIPVVICTVTPPFLPASGAGGGWLLEWNEVGPNISTAPQDPERVNPLYMLPLFLSGDFVLDAKNAPSTFNPLRGPMTARISTELGVAADTSIQVKVTADDKARLELNGVILTPDVTLGGGAQTFTLALLAGINLLRVYFSEDHFIEDFGVTNDTFLKIEGVGQPLDMLVDMIRAPQPSPNWRLGTQALTGTFTVPNLTGNTAYSLSNAAPQIVNLPPANESFFTLSLTKTDANTNAITVTAAGADTINGASTYILNAQWQSVLLLSDGVSNWNVIAAASPSVEPEDDDWPDLLMMAGL